MKEIKIFVVVIGVFLFVITAVYSGKLAVLKDILLKHAEDIECLRREVNELRKQLKIKQ